jgi:putative addiction module CopG family antidote
MSIDFPLPPDLERFIRDQLAAGHFRSEDELVRTALHLLEEQSHVPEPAADWLKAEIDKGLCSRPAEPVTPQFWDQLRRRLRAAASGR